MQSVKKCGRQQKHGRKPALNPITGDFSVLAKEKPKKKQGKQECARIVWVDKQRERPPIPLRNVRSTSFSEVLSPAQPLALAPAPPCTLQGDSSLTPTPIYIAAKCESYFKRLPAKKFAKMLNNCLELDEFQTVAFKNVLLENRVGLVEGSPGTGKTFLARKIIQSLQILKIKTLFLSDEPINFSLMDFEKVWHIKGPGNPERPDDVEVVTKRIHRPLEFHLNDLGIQVVIVENAKNFEELELLREIPIGVEHIILMGDTKVAKPKPQGDAARSMGPRLGPRRPSIFERLAEEGHTINRLMGQHRLNPLLSKLIARVYPDVGRNSTSEPPVLVHPVFFITHTSPEELEQTGQNVMDYFNVVEAEKIAQLIEHLSRISDLFLKTTDVVILTLHNTQKQLIAKKLKELKKLKEVKELKSVRVFRVDEFRGQEADVVLLSLVRGGNPSRGVLGQLMDPVKACKVFSRAKHGLYIVGHQDFLSCKEWQGICSFFKSKRLVGEELPVV